MAKQVSPLLTFCAGILIGAFSYSTWISMKLSDIESVLTQFLTVPEGKSILVLRPARDDSISSLEQARSAQASPPVGYHWIGLYRDPLRSVFLVFQEN